MLIGTPLTESRNEPKAVFIAAVNRFSRPLAKVITDIAGSVAERRNELNAKGKPTTPMAVCPLQHAKDLHAADDMGALPGTGEHAIFLTLFGGEGRRSRRLMGGDGVPVASPQALISGIPDQDRLVRKSHARLTEQLQIMNGPSARGGAQHGAALPCTSAPETSGYGAFSSRCIKRPDFFGLFTRHFRSFHRHGCKRAALPEIHVSWAVGTSHWR